VTAALWVVGAYLLGSFPTSYVASRYGAGIDLRQHGSGNLGATNVYRVLGWRYAVPVALVDVAKGAVPVFVARSGPSAGWLPLGVGLAAVLGHVFSVFVRFHGGKGVATAAGVVLALAPSALAVSAVVWLVLLKTTGYMSLASLAGAPSFPIAVRVITPSERYALWVGVGLAAFIVYTHRTNILRLVRGTENRFGHGRADAGGS
jgi:acyl phosphate:glycerol-3-phosphate acyltransferase